MNKNKILLLVLYTLALAAILYYPVSKIVKFEVSPDYEEFKFKVTVYDPYDPMRGRYVQLQVTPDIWESADRDLVRHTGYAVIRKDSKGFAEVLRLTADFPQLPQGEYVVKVNSIYSHCKNEKSNIMEYHFTWPFNRFYLNELKAPELEKELRRRNTPMILKVKIFNDGSFAVTGMEKH